LNAREWPLVLFTLSGQAAAGLAFFYLLPLYSPSARAALSQFRAMRLGAVLGVFLLSAAAAVLSFGHLGRIRRAPRSVVNLKSSWLSREIAALVLFIAAAAFLAVGEWRGLGASVRTALAGVTTAAGGIFVYTMSRLYMLRTVPEWNTAATPVAFFSSAAVLGATLASVVVRAGYPGLRTDLPVIALAAMGLAYLAAFLFAPRFGLLARKEASPAFKPDPRLPSVFAARMTLFALAILVWSVSILRPETAGPAAWISLALLLAAEVLGRQLFYSIPQNL